MQIARFVYIISVYRPRSQVMTVKEGLRIPMVSEKKRIQQLKQPDEFQKKAFRLLDWLTANKSVAIGILVPIGLAVVGGFGWNYLQKQQAEDRRDQIAEIDLTFRNEAEAAKEQQDQVSAQISALQKQLDDLKKKVKDGDKSQASSQKLQELETKHKELSARYKTMEPDHKASFEKYLAVYGQHKDTPEGWRAGLSASSIQINRKEYAKASELLKEILTNTRNIPFYQFQVRSVYMGLLEEQGQFDVALEEKEALIDSAATDDKPKALLQVGRLEHLAGKKEEALKTLDLIINEHNASQEAQKARAIKALW